MTEQVAQEVHSGTDVVNAEVFGDLWAFLMDNYTEDDAKLTEAYIAMRAACAILESQLSIKHMDVVYDAGEAA